MLNELNNKNIIVTGGYGFIGNHLIRLLIEKTSANLIVIDGLTYAAKMPDESFRNTHQFVYADISSHWARDTIHEKLNESEIDYVIHLAAESHVDNSITDPHRFANTNVIGTLNILEIVKKFNSKLVHVSTDEVYGHLTNYKDQFTEETPLNPRSPYSASKASSDLLVQSYVSTYGINANITRCCNNFGIYQHREKFIPTCVRSILNNKPIPLYGSGKNIREWIHAKDHALAILKVAVKGEPGHVYNIGSGNELSNLELANKLIDFAQKQYGYEGKIDYVSDRLGHDFRYAIDNTKYRQSISNDNYITLDESLHEIFEYYKKTF
jgi:dTDP-glucose 4,6-dehydratase